MVENQEKIIYVPTENNPTEDGNRRQWMNFTLNDLPIKKLNIKANAKNYESEDDDDIKLIIDGEIQKNAEDKAHKNWFWCGRVSKGVEKEFNKRLKLKQGLNYIELWADRMPFLHKVEIELEKIKEELGEEKAEEKPVKSKTPTVDNPKWTGNFNDDTEQMILARAIFGEARQTTISNEARIGVGWSIRTRVEAQKRYWGYTYHEVILKDNQYSAFWEKYPKDKNLKILRDPLKDKNPIDKKSWENCYKIAGQVMQGKVNDSTDGATFYHDVSLSQEYFVTEIVPGAKFIKKIDRFVFYLNPKP